MKSKNLLSTVLTPIPILKTLSAVASACDDCPIEFDPETQSAGDPLSYRIDNVLADDQSTFLISYSGWCPCCQQQMPIIDRLEDEYAGLVTFIRINVTARPDHAKEFGVSALPTMIIIRGTDEDGHLREEPFNNIGTVNTTGTAVIRVLNSTGGADEFRHNVTNLTPSGSVSFSDTLDTSGAEAGSSYRVIGYSCMTVNPPIRQRLLCKT